MHLPQLLLRVCNVDLHSMKRTPLYTVVAILLFAGCAYLFAWSSLFTVKSVSIVGAPTQESQTLVLKLIDAKKNIPLARVEPRAISRRINAIDWVEKSSISRNWLRGTVKVTLTPRVPIAYFNGKTLDASGKVFLLPGFAGTKLPEVSSPRPSLGLAAINLFEELPSEVQRTVISLVATNESSFHLRVLRDGRALSIIWGKNEQNELKLKVIDALLAKPENKKIQRIDVSAPHAPIVK